MASGGGHWVQLLRLRPALLGAEVVYVTVDRSYRTDVGGSVFHVVYDATRWNKWGLLRLALGMLLVVARERPDVVLTTGAAPGYIAVVIGRIFGARTAWIDSMANVEKLSLSGQKVGRWADLWLTQWPHLAKGDGVAHEGAVL